MLSVKVSSKNQISLPSEARRRLDIHPGDRLAVDIRDDEIVLRRPKKASQRLRGLGKGIWEGVDPVEYVRALRDEWDREDHERDAPVDH